MASFGPMPAGRGTTTFSVYPPMAENEMPPPPPPGAHLVVQQQPPSAWATPSPPPTTPSPGVSPDNVDLNWPALNSPVPVAPPLKALTPPTSKRPTSSDEKVRVTLNYCNPPSTPPPGQFYSHKVFVGGLGDDVYQGSRSSIGFMQFFEQFGRVRIEFPPRRPVTPISVNRPMRYLHVIYHREESVHVLLRVCHQDAGGRYFLQFGCGYPAVNVRPFIVHDGKFRAEGVTDVDQHFNSVLMTNVPRHYPASKLAFFASRHFGPVSAVDIRLDRHYYPMGSAIVTFTAHDACVRAVYSKFFELQDYFRCWDVNIQPFAVFEGDCERCGEQPSTHFCRNVACLHYFCESCFTAEHDDFPHPGEGSPDVMIRPSEEERPPVRRFFYNGTYNAPVHVFKSGRKTAVASAAENNSDEATSDVSV